MRRFVLRGKEVSHRHRYFQIPACIENKRLLPRRYHPALFPTLDGRDVLMPESASQIGHTAKFRDDPIDVGLGGGGLVFHGVHDLRNLRTKSTWKAYDFPQKLRSMGKSVPRALESFRKRSRLSLDELARRASFRRASSIQRYLSEADFDKDFLKPDTARRFAKIIMRPSAGLSNIRQVSPFHSNLSGKPISEYSSARSTLKHPANAAEMTTTSPLIRI